MVKRAIRIFLKDIKLATRDAMILYVIAIPILLAFGILFFAPGITDSATTVALLEDAPKDYISYIETYAKVELFSDEEGIEQRVLKRDDAVGVIQKGEGYAVILEGNESEQVERMARSLSAYYDLGATRDNTTAKIFSFNKTVPPLKTKLVNMLILMIIMLAGMIIALGIVEEKVDNTISAINVTPVSQNTFILGKCLLGGGAAIASIIISLLILGYYDINWLMIILVGMTTAILTITVGFLQGLSANDAIEAAGNVKLMMLPIAGSIAGYELLSEKWQWVLYWSPFYWSYKANDLILSKHATWQEVILYSAFVLIISIGIYIVAMPKIRKGLSRV